MLVLQAFFALALVGDVLIADVNASLEETEKALIGIGTVISTEPNGVLRVKLDRKRLLPEVASVLKSRGVEYILPVQAAQQSRTDPWVMEQRINYFEAGTALRLGRVVARQDNIHAGFLPAYQHWLKTRADVDQGIDPLLRDAALAQRKSLPAALMVTPVTPGHSATNVGLWEYVGPRLTDPGAKAFGQAPHSGRKNGIAISYQNPELIYTASGAGGVWKTQDGGVQWEPLSDGWDFLGTNCVAVNPANDDIVLVGTGDFDWDRAEHFGMMRSIDGGATWLNIPKDTFGFRQIRKILWDPELPNVVLAITSSTLGRTTEGGIYKSSDWGLNWTLTTAPSMRWDDIDLSVYDPSVGYRTYYAVAGNYFFDKNFVEYGTLQDGNLYKSIDRGTTWTAVATPATGFGQFIMDIACSKVDADRLYAICPANDQVFKSLDAGATWSDISAGFPHFVDNGSKSHWDQDDYDLYIETSFEGATDVLFVGLLSLVGSPDGGNTWIDLGLSYESNDRIHADQQCLTIDPSNPRFAYVGNDGGIYKMFWDSRTVGSIQFEPKNVNIHDFLVVAFEPHPTNPDFLLSGLQDLGSQGSRGSLLDWTTLTGGDGGWPSYDQKKPKVHYSTSQYLETFARYETRFASTYVNVSDPTWTRANTDFLAPIIHAGSQGDLLFAGAENDLRLLVSVAPLLWQGSGQFMGKITEIAVSAGGTTLYIGNDQGDLYRRGPSGSTTYLVNAGGPIGCIAVHPADPDRILVGTLNNLFGECLDTTPSTGLPVLNDMTGIGTALPGSPVPTVCYDPYTSDTWYVGTDEGLYKTVDAGLNWTHMKGIPNAAVSVVAVGPDKFLYAATRGRGIWRAALYQVFLNGAGPLSSHWFGGDDIGLDVTMKVFVDRPIRVRLEDDSPDVFVPEDVWVPPGNYSTHLEVPTLAVDRRTSVRIRALYDGATESTAVNLYPKPPIQAVDAAPNPVRGGQPVQVRILMPGRVPADATIHLDDNSPFLVAPPSIVIPRGERMGTFTATTLGVTSAQTVTLRARFGGSTRTVQVRINP